MLNQEKILAKYRENYEMAIEDGHAEEAERIAWEWTEEDLMRQFARIKDNHQAAHAEAVNKSFFG